LYLPATAVFKAICADNVLFIASPIVMFLLKN